MSTAPQMFEDVISSPKQKVKLAVDLDLQVLNSSTPVKLLTLLDELMDLPLELQPKYFTIAVNPLNLNTKSLSDVLFWGKQR